MPPVLNLRIEMTTPVLLVPQGLPKTKVFQPRLIPPNYNHLMDSKLNPFFVAKQKVIQPISLLAPVGRCRLHSLC